ncbi:hypothetical protein L540_08085 [Bordetella pseudohinzii]|nr:hypothetical protein BBN53_21090 [Bordetella pseudohinzii]KMM24079.1 hypothetical protein L540_08085 [Bordetella pseudohinzii]
MRPADLHLLDAIHEVNLMYLTVLQRMAKEGSERLGLNEHVRAWLESCSQDDLGHLARKSMLLCSMSLSGEAILAALAQDVTGTLAGLRCKRRQAEASVLAEAR